MSYDSFFPGASPVARAVRLAVACALGMATTVTAAADWNYEPKVALSYEYDDNDRLTNVKGNEIEVSGPKLDAQLAMTAATPTTTFLLAPRYRGTYYFEGEEDNSNDGFLNMALRNTGQRLESYLLADWSTVITLGNYFPSAQGTGDGDLGSPPTGDTVPYVAGKNRRDQWRITPGATYQLTERQSIGVNAEYLDTNFRKDVPGDYVDFQNLYVGGDYTLKTSQTSDLALVAGYSKYEPEDGGSTDYWDVSGEWTKKWSETSEVFFRAGSSFVKSDEPGFKSDGYSSGFTGGAGVRWAFEITNIFLDATQYMNPTSQGNVVTRSQVRFEVRRQLSQMMT